MEKQFKIEKDKLIVTINNENDVFIPVDGNQEKIGRYTQVTTQIIDLDKADRLKALIEKEYETGKKNMVTIDKQFEAVKDLQDIDEKILSQCKRAIDKGSKEFKKSMASLNQRIIDLDKKKTLIAQKEYLTGQITEMESDLEHLNKLLNKSSN